MVATPSRIWRPSLYGSGDRQKKSRFRHAKYRRGASRRRFNLRKPPMSLPRQGVLHGSRHHRRWCSTISAVRGRPPDCSVILPGSAGAACPSPSNAGANRPATAKARRRNIPTFMVWSRSSRGKALRLEVVLARFCRTASVCRTSIKCPQCDRSVCGGASDARLCHFALAFVWNWTLRAGSIRFKVIVI
jgi:hypothetical protein